MLKRENRITKAGDFRATRRRATRVRTAHLMISIKTTDETTRFGFIVPNTVGKAVTRNTIKRRLREIAAEIIVDRPVGLDVVVHVQPEASKDGAFDSLRSQVLGAVARARK